MARFDTVLKARHDMLWAMDTIVRNMNNSDAYARWIYIVPDDADDDDFWDIADYPEPGDDPEYDLYDCACKLFRKLMHDYGDDGFFIWNDPTWEH